MKQLFSIITLLIMCSCTTTNRTAEDPFNVGDCVQYSDAVQADFTLEEANALVNRDLYVYIAAENKTYYTAIFLEGPNPYESTIGPKEAANAFFQLLPKCNYDLQRFNQEIPNEQ